MSAPDAVRYEVTYHEGTETFSTSVCPIHVHAYAALAVEKQVKMIERVGLGWYACQPVTIKPYAHRFGYYCKPGKHEVQP